VDFDTTDPADTEGLLDEVLASFLEAEEAGQSPDRQELLRQHPALRAPLSRFFAEHDRLSFLAQPLRGAVRAATVGLEGRRIGHYQVLEPIGWGGMGVVYKAVQESPGRLVALKVMRSGRLASPRERQRFENEAAAEARLDHPNIVPVYEVGEYEGHPYFSMKLLEGGSLDQYLLRGAAEAVPRLPVRQAVALVATVARAVHHAHQRGILHRDLKPSNVLLDGAGLPYVADFGLARHLEADSSLTDTGAILGTPGYMAPEQAVGHKDLVTVAADVYGLGAILYALLTGRAPFQGGSALDVLARVRQQEPEAPSRKNPRVDRDLEAVCLKCLEKEPAVRYASAEALAEDLGRWLAGEPTHARPVGKMVRAWRWCRRKKALAGLLAASLLLIIGAVAALSMGLVAVSQSRAEAEARAATLRRQLYPADIARAYYHFQRGQAEELAALLARYVPAPGQEDIRGFEWYLLRQPAHTMPREQLCYRGHRGEVMCAVFAPGGREVVSGDTEGEIHCWDPATGACRRVLRGHQEDVNGLDFSPDGRTLASGGEDGTVRLWDFATGEQTARLSGCQGEVEGVSFSADGRRIVSPGSNGLVCVWNEAGRSLELQWLAHKDRIYTAVFSPDGRTIATASGDAHCKVWDADSAALLLDMDLRFSAFDVCFSPDGTRLATADGNGMVRLWDAKTGSLLHNRARHDSAARAVAFSHDGKRLASVGDDQVLHLWIAGQGLPQSRTKAHGHTITSVAFSPDGKTLVTVSRDHTVRVWDTSSIVGRALPFLAGHKDVQATLNIHAALSSDGRLLALWAPPGWLTLYDWQQWRAVASMGGLDGGVALSPDGQAVVALSNGARTINRFRLRREGRSSSLALEWRYSADAEIFQSLTFSSDGAWLAAATGGGLLLWARDSQAPTVLSRKSGQTSALASGSRRLAAAFGRSLQLLDLQDLRWDGDPLELEADVLTLAYSRDDQLLAAGCTDGRIVLMDPQAMTVQGTLVGHRHRVTSLAFAADGRTLVSGSTDGTVRLWHVATRQELFTLEDRLGTPINSVTFTPDGTTLITAGDPAGDFSNVMFWSAPRDEGR
jgi:WD40 repeat protein